MYKKFKISVVFFSLGICMLTVGVLLFTMYQMDRWYARRLMENAMEQERRFASYAVDHIIDDIEQEQAALTDMYTGLVQNIKSSAMDYLNGRTDFVEAAKEFFFLRTSFGRWSLLGWDIEKHKVLYESERITGMSWDGNTKTLDDFFTAYAKLEHGLTVVYYGIPRAYVEHTIKGRMLDYIRSYDSDDILHVSVNEIVHYDGGDRYAVCRAMPRLPAMEGMFLSTNTMDARGNYPLKTELEGLLDKGEVFYDFYVKSHGAADETQRFTYAKLYKPYDWVISTSLLYDDVLHKVAQSAQRQSDMMFRFALVLVIFVPCTFLFSFLFLVYTGRRFYGIRVRRLVQAASIDPLTKAENRRSGTEKLDQMFAAFKRDQEDPAIVVLDIDDFKAINDTYGHSAGDAVLKELTDKMRAITRSSDSFIRWGGDEFVGLFPSVPRENYVLFGRKILSTVSDFYVAYGEMTIKVTVSAGLTYFRKSDRTFIDVIDRVDGALYKSKSSGKNTISFIL